MKAFATFASLALTAAIVTAASYTSHAGTLPRKPLTLQASVIPDCVTLIAPSLAFTLAIGSVQAPGNVFEAQSNISVRCTAGSNVSIGMDSGLYAPYATPQFGHRAMKQSSGTTYLTYDLCQDAACSRLWAATGYSYVSATSAATATPVIARVISGQRVVRLDAYSDAVTTTVNF